MREMCSKCWTPFGLKVGPDRLLFHAAVLLLILTVIYTFVVGVGAVFYLTGSPEVSAGELPPAYAGGFLLHPPPHRERVHRLFGAFRAC